MIHDREELRNLRLYRMLSKHNPVLMEFLSLNDPEHDPTFLGFIDTYFYLSKLIPKHWTIVDFGCCHAPQSYYFRHHKSYIGVDCSIPTEERFKFKNHLHYQCSIEEFIDSLHINSEVVDAMFAICNYVPADTGRVRGIFRNNYIYYPQRDFQIKPPVIPEKEEE